MEAEKDQELLELLQRWSGLSDAQRAAFQALTNEVDIASNLMEAGVEALSTQFQSLASNASKLSTDMFNVLQDADKVEINGELVPLEDTISHMEGAFDELVSKVVDVSKTGVKTAYELNDLSAHAKEIAESVAEMQHLNEETSDLVTNKGNENLAKQLHTLSEAMKKTASHVSDEMEGISESVEKGRDNLEVMSSIDLANSVKAMEHLAELRVGLEERQARFISAITISMQDSRAVNEDVTKLTTTIQFQDRTSQRLQHIKDSLEVIGEMLQKIDSETTTFTSGVKEKLTKEELLSQLIAGFNLAEVKERFIRAALRGETIDNELSEAEHLESSDDIDLF